MQQTCGTARLISLAFGLSLVPGAEAVRAEEPRKIGDVVITGFLEAESGFDSNPDNRFFEDGTSLLKGEGGLTFSRLTKATASELNIGARGVDFDQLEEGLEKRWDARASFHSTIALSDADKLKFGLSGVRDFFSLQRADIARAYLDYTHTADTSRWRFQGRSHVEQNIESDVQGTLALDIFNVTRDRAFDYVRTDGQVGFIGLTNKQFQPFFIYQVADLSYYHQVANPTVDRDAMEQFGIAGIRYQPNKDFRFDLGWRVSYRDFGDLDVPNFATDFVDINAFWQVTETFKLTGVVERFFSEPSTSLGLADDTTAYGVTADWDLTPKLRFSTAVHTYRQAPIGDDFKFFRTTLSGVISYDMNDTTQYFISAYGRWVEETVTGDSYDRYKIGSGVRIRF